MTEKKIGKTYGYVVDFLYLCIMIEKPTYEDLEQQIARLKARIAYLERMLYGAKSDRLASKASDEGQLPGLFDDEFKEAMEEKHCQIEQMVKEIEAEREKRHEREKKKSSRPAKYHYAGLEERTTVLTPEGINLDEYDVIGKDVTRVLHRSPAQVWVEVIERPLYRLKADKYAPNPRIVQAETPHAVIGGNHVAADMLSQIIIDKYCYHLPEYRQIKRYADLGLKLPASTLNDWVHALAVRLEPLYEAQRCETLQSDYLQVDEVPWNIADRPKKVRKGYAWQFLDNRPESHGLYFLYKSGSREGAIPRAELKDFRGAIQTDDYVVYDYFEDQENVTLLGCMAHVRRKFVNAQISHPQLAAQAVQWINILYTLEANLQADGATAEEKAKARTEKALPIMDAMKEWMTAVHTQCTPSDPMGKALEHAYKLWPRLRRYALDGRYQIDNNPVERGQRPTVLGRKNYLFSKNDDGAVDNAIFYTLIESCQVVGLKPLAWLNYVLENLRDDTPPEQLKAMLPYYYKKSHE